MKHLDYCTHITNKEDRDILTRRSFDVNLRLMKTSGEYNKLITEIANYIRWCGETKKDGYAQPKGWSGPNAGIPFRIIYVPPHGIMINPKWMSTSNDGADLVKSNCGSLTLSTPRQVIRHKSIRVKWWDLNGNKFKATLNKDNGGYTFQHEYNHCQGELI